MDCFSFVVRRLRKITRQFNVPSGLCVGVLAMLAWLVCVFVGLCELLTISKLAIKSLIGGGYEPTWPAPYNTTVTLKILKFFKLFSYCGRLKWRQYPQKTHFYSNLLIKNK